MTQRESRPVGRQSETAAKQSGAILDRAADEDSDRCRRCGRPVRSKLAVLAGMGATCALRAAAEWWQPELPLDEAVGR